MFKKVEITYHSAQSHVLTPQRAQWWSAQIREALVMVE